jgi:hypothetical protein
MQKKLHKLLQRSFTAAGCGDSQFQNLTTYGQHRDEARSVQEAIETFRFAVLAVGQDDAEFGLRYDLGEIGIGDEAYIRNILANPFLDSSDVYIGNVAELV